VADRKELSSGFTKVAAQIKLVVEEQNKKDCTSFSSISKIASYIKSDFQLVATLRTSNTVPA